MRIVINAFSARRGGGQTYLVTLLQHMDALGNGQLFVLAQDSLKLPEDERIIRLHVDWPTENPLLRSIWEKCVFPAVLKKIKADILFCPGGLINTKVPAGCRTVTMFRNMIPFMPAVRRQYPLGPSRVRNWLLERAMLSSMLQANLVIFISDYARGVIESHAGRSLNRAVTIPHGISDHFRVDSHCEPPRPDWLPDEEYLLYVSIFEPYKHHLEVLRGFHRLKSLRLTKEKLVLAGKNDMPAGVAVREEINRLNLQDDVILAGNIAYQELPALYRHAKINIFASECENCPNILLEALGVGRPLLVSDIPPMPEFGGEAVVYFDPNSPDAFAKQMFSIIDRPEELGRLGELAATQARKYDWSVTAHQTWTAIRELAEAHG